MKRKIVLTPKTCFAIDCALSDKWRVMTVADCEKERHFVSVNPPLRNTQKLNNLVARMDVLLGDTTANGSVNSSDISQTKAQSGTVASSSNFRTDVTING